MCGWWGQGARAGKLLCQYNGLTSGNGRVADVQCPLERLREAPANLGYARVPQGTRVLSVLEELNLLLGRAGELVWLFEP